MSKRNGRMSGLAFGFIPIWWDGEAFEGKNWLCEVALDFCLAFVGTFMPDSLEEGVPLKVYEE